MHKTPFGRNWTEEELDFVRTNYPSKKSHWIATQLSRTRRAVCFQALRMGLKKSHEYLLDLRKIPNGLRHGHAGVKKTKEYRAWHHVLGRCNNPKDKGFADYGGRGIRVCEDWKDFANFLAYVGPAPSESHSTGRIDNNGNYEPGNVRWETPLQQARNTRRTVWVGKLCLKEACELAHVSYGAAQRRIRLGQPAQEAIDALKKRAVLKQQGAKNG